MNVAVLLFDDVEPLDFCGPLEVFQAVKVPGQPLPFEVFTCAQETRPILATGGLSINPKYDLDHCPVPEILVVPGGWGTREQLSNASLMAWLRTAAPKCRVVLSVCTGALLLAKARLLDGLSATTHHEAIDLLQLLAPSANIRRFERFVDNGQIVVAAGITAGIDAALHVVERLLGAPVAQATAEYLEWHSARGNGKTRSDRT